MIKINYVRLTPFAPLAGVPGDLRSLERSERVRSQRGCRGQNAHAATSTDERGRMSVVSAPTAVNGCPRSGVDETREERARRGGAPRLYDYIVSME